MDETLKGFESSLEQFSGKVKGLGEAVTTASEDVKELKEKALEAGGDISAVESKVKGHRLSLSLIDFLVKGKGEDIEVTQTAIRFLDRLSEWVESHPKYSGLKTKILHLKDAIERQLILG